MWLTLFYARIFALTFGWRQIQVWLSDGQENLFQGIAMPVIALIGISAVVIWRIAFTTPDGLLHLTVLDLGSGDAILLQTSGGRSVLINGGPLASLLSDGLGGGCHLLIRTWIG